MISLVRALLLLASLGAVSGVFLDARHNTEAGHNPPVATFAVDVNIEGNTYTRDPNADGSPADNSLVVATADFCIQVPAPGPQTIDIVARNTLDLVGYDVRLNYDPSLAVIATVEPTPFLDPPSTVVGFINLPVESGDRRRGVIPAPNLETAGSVFFATTYLGGDRTAFASPDHPHAPSVAEPYAANDPDGVTLLRLSFDLDPASNGQIVPFDLTNQTQPGNDYIALDPATGDGEIVPVPEANLIDGAIAVNTACPAPPPGAGPVVPAQTPGPGGATPPGSTPGGSPGGADGTGSPSPNSTSASPTDGNGPGGRDSDDDDDGDGGPLGTGSGWEIPVLVAVALLILASAGGAFWLWRRRFR